MPLESVQQRAARESPDLDRAVCGAGGEVGAVGGEFHGGHAVAVAVEGEVGVVG